MNIKKELNEKKEKEKNDNRSTIEEIVDESDVFLLI